jgi:DNA repair exonuclease SbcCD ATPase subunit
MSEKQGLIYIKILIDTLKKKKSILANLTELTKEQEKILAESNFSVDSFDAVMLKKEDLIQELNQIEDGFETIFKRVEPFINEKKDEFRQELVEAQTLITQLTDISISLQVLEAKNKEKLVQQLSGRRQEIRGFRNTSQAAGKYQNNMANQHQEGQSYFLDKKK